MFLHRFASSFQPGPWLPLSSWTYLLRRVWIRLAGLPHSPRHPQGDHDSIYSKKLSVCGGTPLNSQTIPTGWLCWTKGQSHDQEQGQARDHALSPWSPSRSSDSPGTENRKEQRTQPKPAGRWVRTWWMPEVQEHWEVKPARRVGTVGMGFTSGGQAKGMHSSRMPQRASEGVLRP